MTTRRRWVAAVLVAVMLSVNVVLLMSDRVALWWRDPRLELTWRLPEPLRYRAFQLRQWDNADVHVLLWMPISAVAVLLATTLVHRMTALLAVFAASIALEIGQGLFTSRGMQSGDLAGNAIGVMAGAVIGYGFLGAAALLSFVRRSLRRSKVARAHGSPSVSAGTRSDPQ